MGQLLRRELVVIIALGAMAASAYLPSEAQVIETVTPTVTPAPPTPPPPTPTPIPVFAPEGIALPKLGVEAPIIRVGTAADGAMGTPSNARDVAWWDGTPVGAGNALLAGHKNYSGVLGTFHDLISLVPGDEIRVWGEGRELVFRVEWIRQVPGNTTDTEDILGEVGAPVVTLITCGGEFDRSIRSHLDRVIVRGILA